MPQTLAYFDHVNMITCSFTWLNYAVKFKLVNHILSTKFFKNDVEGGNRKGVKENESSFNRCE